MTDYPQLTAALSECQRLASINRKEYEGFLKAKSPTERLQYASAAGIRVCALIEAFDDAKARGFDLRSAAHLVNYILLAVIACKQEVSP